MSGAEPEARVLDARMSADTGQGGRIGSSIEKVREQLLTCGNVLARLVEPASRPLIDDALSQLSQLTCRIAVVGQIKSGKSSFINAFVRKPHLLPTAVTPWTTTITNLHFRQPAPGGFAAIFKFMRQDEWREIAQGGGKIRELTQRLVPDFELAVLQQQADALTARAKERLGAEFDQLLGQAHAFPTLAPRTLADYVCSGEFSTQAMGKYSDITKSADIFFQQGPFDFACTVTDTPGTNDPFLFRDEITRRCLGSADIYIVVLTARQPLSDSDIALLRMMRGLNKDRIVVLINRIDDLADVETELPQVLSYVRERLAAEFPGSTIPVTYGSAWWAEQAMTFDVGSVGRILQRPSARYILRAGLLNAQELDPNTLAQPEACGRIAQSLYAMSGLPAAYEAIDSLVGTTTPAFMLSQIARSFTEMARACESGARSELQLLLAAQADRREQTSRDERLQIYTKEHDLLTEVAANIEASARAIEAQLATIIHEETERLRQTFRSTIEFHARRERDILVNTLQRGRSSSRVWTHEGLELRRALAKDFREIFEAAARRLVSFHERFVPELHRMMRSLVPETDLSAGFGAMPAIPTPTIAPLSRMLVLDLDDAKWSHFWSRQSSVETSGEKIERLIRAEFTPIGEELVQLAGNVFKSIGTTTIRWSFSACRNIQQALNRQLEVLLAEYEAAKNAVEDQTALSDEAGRISAQTQRLQDNEALTTHLETLSSELDKILRKKTSPS
jgi:hypothetical protein